MKCRLQTLSHFCFLLFSLGDVLLEAREMEQQLKCLLHRQEVSSLIPKSYVKHWMGMAVNPVLEGKRPGIPWASCLTRHVLRVSSGCDWDTLPIKMKWKPNWRSFPISRSDLYRKIHTHTWSHPHASMLTNIHMYRHHSYVKKAEVVKRTFFVCSDSTSMKM